MASKKGKSQVKSNLIFGVGINDSPDPVYEYENIDGIWKRQWKCPFYSRWTAMLQRCYSSDWIEKYPTYADCWVCDDWLIFSNFKRWMARQSWEVSCGEKAKHLDKDIIIEGNKLYSPETTAFISHELNLFIGDRKTSPRHTMGVVKKRNRFQARCNNPFTKTRIHLGTFDTAEEAHRKWKECKNKIAQEYADQIESKLCSGDSDLRVAKALRTRFL